MRLPIRTFACAVLLTVFLPSCRTTPAPPEYPPDLDRDAAARIVLGRLAGVRGLRAEVGVTFESAGDSRSADGAVVAESPDRVRMQCWGPFGSTVLDLAVRGERATLYLPRERRALRVDLGRLAANPEAGDTDYRSLLLVHSLLDELTIADLEYRLEDDPSPGTGSVVSIRDGVPVSRTVFSRRTLLPVERRRLVDPRYVITFDDYRPFGERWWPGEIRVEAGSRRLTVELDALEENPALPDSLFDVDLPPGVEIEDR